MTHNIAPAAKAQEIIDLIAPTVEVVAPVKPVYNFKSR